MNPREELAALRRMKELEDKAQGRPDFSGGSGSVGPTVQTNPSLFRADSDFRENAGLGVGDMFVAAAKDMFGGDPGQYLADQYNKKHGLSAQINGGAKVVRDSNGDMVRLPNGKQYRTNDKGIDSQDVANVAGNVASFFLPASWASHAAQARGLGLAGRAGMQALAAGGTDAAIQAATNAGDVNLGRTATVAAGGLGGELVGAGLAASGKAAANAVTPEVRALYKAAQAKGIKLTPAQLSDSKFVAYLRKQLGALPGSGAASHAAGQREAFNRAVSDTVGETEPMSREVFDSALTRLGGEFDTFTNRPLPVTNGFMRNVLKVQDEAAAIGDADSARNMKAMADRIFKAGSAGRIDGRAVQSIDSQLSKLQAAGGERAYYASQMREALHTQLEKNMPQADFEAWKQTRKQYANLMKITGLVAKDGEVSPGKLMGAVTANKAGKRAMARNRGGDLGELARIGQMMKLPPTSGTPEGAQAAAVGVGMLANPLKTVAGLTAGRGVRAMSDSDLLAQFMMSQSRGAGRQAVAPYVPGVGVGVMRYPYVNGSDDGP